MALICPVYFNFPSVILFSVWKASEVTSFGADWEALMQKRSHRWRQIQSLAAYTRYLLPALFVTAIPSSASLPEARAVREGDLWAQHPFGQHWDGMLSVCFVALRGRALRQALNTHPTLGEGVKYLHQLKDRSQKPHGADCCLLGSETFCKVSARNAPILLSWTLRAMEFWLILLVLFLPDHTAIQYLPWIHCSRLEGRS